MWDVIKDWVFDVIQFFYNGVGDWGMAIIIITIIFRIIVAPLVHKSTTANFAMQKVQPLLQEIQTKFADDPVRQREEMQRLYAETKFNPLAGCLPMLIQMPVFIALYQVLYSMVDRMPEGMTYQFYHLVPDLTKNPATAMGEGFLAFIPYHPHARLRVCYLCSYAPSAEEQQGSESETPDAHDVRHYVAVHALDFLVRSRRRAFVLGRFFGLRGYSAAAHDAFPEEEGRRGRGCR